MSIDRYYARHLPHQIPGGYPIFLTWNLKGAMPKAVIEAVLRERRRLEEQAPRSGESVVQRRIREGKTIFAFADRFLDRAIDGPMHLKDPRAARTVEDAILLGAHERYDLFAWCIMSNHVHALITPHQELSQVTRRIKGSTAREINRLQDAEGRTFWQDESYDHWCRDEDEVHRIISYIENNPVAAGLCRLPEEWPWSSARLRDDWARGEVHTPCRSGSQPDADRSEGGPGRRPDGSRSG
jgi:REP element-mobilizing transposase RayT